ncbi:FmdB family transcriptional regulator [Hoyosella sp. G463]|uniref:FmdB family transcriptional regulator n=1 Tax=Lolliginicoccus lacisalsi TaxID=2742202 RepID=A0A927JBN4_9ACTN|nr:FmdB family zinc ribbon protein [Lolliginicoccus lacisalsi]MBD8506101.1 FmdB family transcriptional regulator [Lolliginicoccus lacisalsi]
MPTYSYACTACDHQFDIVQSFTDDALTECDRCDGKLRKLFNSVGIVFKGSGFYRTDSRSSASASTGSSTSSPKSSGSQASPSQGSSSQVSSSQGSSSQGSSSQGSSTQGSSSS